MVLCNWYVGILSNLFSLNFHSPFASIFIFHFFMIQMYEELQVLSPLVSTREFYFLRYCQQIEQGLWAIVDVSYDFPQDNQFAPQFRSHRLPSGVFIQDMPNGYSKVTLNTICCCWLI